MEGARKAALYLHGLTAADREWLLSQLPASEIDSLRGLLDELQMLGIPNEPLLEAASTAVEPTITITDSDSELQSEHDLLHGADPDAVVQLLIHEPIAVISTLMRISNWSWKKPLLEALSTPRHEQLMASLNSAAYVTPRVQAALLDAVNVRFASKPASMCVVEPRRTAEVNSLPARWWRRIWPR